MIRKHSFLIHGTMQTALTESVLPPWSAFLSALFSRYPQSPLNSGHSTAFQSDVPPPKHSKASAQSARSIKATLYSWYFSSISAAVINTTGKTNLEKTGFSRLLGYGTCSRDTKVETQGRNPEPRNEIETMEHCG